MNTKSLIELFTSPFAPSRAKARAQADASAAEIQRLDRETAALNSQWEDLVQNYERIHLKAENAKAELANSERDLAGAKRELAQLIGVDPANGLAARKADAIHTRQMSRPIHAAAVETLCDELRAHIKTMKAFGEKHGVPKAALDALAVP